jgi:poly(3-hydroxybutyrate) depolymerase
VIAGSLSYRTGGGRARPLAELTVLSMLAALALTSGCRERPSAAANPGGSAPGAAPADRLAPLTARTRGSITVSGISAGGYMAGQFHVAHSAAVSGAAILAAGPYYCAQNSMTLALAGCLSGMPEIPVERLAGITGELAAAGRIDAIAGLAGDRVWLFHGAQDTVVRPAVGEALERYYRAYLAPGDLARATLPNAAHTFPTLESGGTCEASEPPFLGACGFDAAGALLAHLYGTLEPRGAASDGDLTLFDQRPYARAAGSRGLDAQGWLYVPRSCSAGRRCRLHIVFHGCKQGASFVGERFVRSAGYLEWAGSNDIVLLFPQVAPSFQPLNPNGCWDWWGYEGSDYATRDGAQIDAVWRMVIDLGSTTAG